MNEEKLQELEFINHPIGKHPFSPEGAPISLKVKGVKIDFWKLENGSAGEMPKSPVRIENENLKEKAIELELIPYGCTHLRITEFPTLSN